MSDGKVVDIKQWAESKRERGPALVPAVVDGGAGDVAVILTADASSPAAIALRPPPPGTDCWELTPDQADELACHLIRGAGCVRAMNAEGGKEP